MAIESKTLVFLLGKRVCVDAAAGRLVGGRFGVSATLEDLRRLHAWRELNEEFHTEGVWIVARHRLKFVKHFTEPALKLFGTGFGQPDKTPTEQTEATIGQVFIDEVQEASALSMKLL